MIAEAQQKRWPGRQAPASERGPVSALIQIRSRLQRFLARHPLVRDALLWAIPALIFGAILRGLMLHYLPYAYWGSDSRSYFGFTEQFLDTGKISLYDKRRYLYLIGLLPVTILPGAPLKWLAWLQHGAGLLTVLPLAYAVRRAFVGWKAWIVPATVLYAGLPILLWYEHEMLAECVFFHGVVWMVAGWMAFVPAHGAAQVRNFWWFFGGLAVTLLTKPAARFFLPPVLFGLVCVFAWRVLRPKHWISLAAVLALTFTIGQDGQGAWLLYTSAFPLTRLETPLHAEYKAEAADAVKAARSKVDASARGPSDKEWKNFVKYPERQENHPLWQALGKDEKKKEALYRELAKEAVLGDPLGFLRIAVGKIIASANPGEFRSDRFLPTYTVEKYRSQYERDQQQKPGRVQRLFGLPKSAPLPPYEEFQQRLAPDPNPTEAVWLRGYVDRFHAAAHLVQGDEEDPTEVALTPLAWWVLVGALLALLPPYFRQVGLPVLMAVSYLFGTFLVGGSNPRYFGAVWGIVLLALCIPLDLVVRSIWGGKEGAA